MARHNRPPEERSNVLPFKQRPKQSPKVHWLVWVTLALTIGMYILILGHFA